MGKSFTILDLPAEERPRERMAQFGERALSAQELLQIILGRGIAGESVAITSQKLLSEFGSLQRLAEASLEELAAVRGIGIAKATQLKAMFEIGRRVQTQTATYKSKDLSDPEKVFKLVWSKIKDYNKEHFYLVALNSRNWSIGEVSVGTLNASLVHPREIFTEAMKNHAASVIFVHNHPSGNTQPSQEDIEITKRLVEAGKLLGIEVTDHVIISKDSYFSFKQKQLI